MVASIYIYKQTKQHMAYICKTGFTNYDVDFPYIF